MKSSNRNLTNYYIILIGILFSPLLIINSSYKINQRELSKTNNNDNNSDINFLRKLDFNSDSMEICSKSSDDLINYFKTGDTSYVSLYTYEEDKEPSEITMTYVNLVTGEGDEDENIDKIKTHLAPMIIFVILGVLCIPGWAIFCSCACCQCKCFKCCKTLKCRTPFFIIVTVTNALFLVICIVGLSIVGPLFEDLADVECSVLRFITEVLDGETKTARPKWAGISGLISIFENTINTIDEMSTDSTTLTSTQTKASPYDNAKNDFIEDLKNACDYVKGEYSYSYIYPSDASTPNYFLDIAYNFGSQVDGDIFTPGSYAEKWVKEAEITDDVTDCYNKLGDVLRIETHEAMTNAQLVLEFIGLGIEEIKDEIGKEILKYSKKIDKYGKIILKLIFSVLLIIAITLETFFILLLIFASRKCNCPKLASFMKILIHLFWNILAFLVILIFISGGAICLIGKLAKDIFETFSFVISSRNLLSPSPKIFENEYEASECLDICINGNGELAERLGIASDLEKVGDLKTLSEGLDIMIDSLITKRDTTVHQDYVFEEITNEVNKRFYNQMDYGFIKKGTQETLTLSQALNQLNQKIETCSIDETWSFSCNPSSNCNSALNEGSCMNLDTCKNFLRTRYIAANSADSPCQAAEESIGIIERIFSSIVYAHSSNANSINTQATTVNSAYTTFLNSATSALTGYTTKFRPFSVIYNDYIGNGSILSFINCAFIGKNVKVMLNYLNDSIGNGFISMGSIFVVIGFIMLANITFTILLLSIINEVARIRSIEKEMATKTNVNEAYNPNINPSGNVIIPSSYNVKI